MIHSLKQLKGCDLAATDATFGSCRDVIFHDHSREVVYFVADLDRWIRGRKALIAPEAVIALERGSIRLKLARDQIEQSPRLEDDPPVSRQIEKQLYSHYGWTPYWKRSDMEEDEVPVPPIGPDSNDRAMETEQAYSGNPRLRSLNEVLDYRALSFGESVGSVVDLLVDDRDWRIHYLVIDVKPWQSGGRRVAPASFIQSVDYEERCVRLTLPPHELEHCADGDQLDFPLDAEARAAVDRINDFAGK